LNAVAFQLLDDGYISFRHGARRGSRLVPVSRKFRLGADAWIRRFDYEGVFPATITFSRLNPLLALPFDFDVIEEGAAAAIQVLDPARSIFVPDSSCN